MPLKITPHKSWNPYSAKNIEKVKLDEAKAKEKQEEERKRRIRYDSANRKEQLLARKRAADTPIIKESESQHLDLFTDYRNPSSNTDLKEPNLNSILNDERNAFTRKAAKKTQSTQLQTDGVSLIDKSVDFQPWYTKALKSQKPMPEVTEARGKNQENQKQRKKANAANANDPLNYINSLLSKKR